MGVMEVERLRDFRFVGAHFIKHGGVVLEADDVRLVEHIRDTPLHRQSFEESWGWAIIRDRTYTIVVEAVRIATTPGATLVIPEIEKDSSIAPGGISSIRWMNNKWRADQKHADLLVKTHSLDVANTLIRSGAIVRGQRVRVHRLVQNAHTVEASYRFFPVRDTPWTWEQITLRRPHHRNTLPCSSPPAVAS